MPESLGPEEIAQMHREFTAFQEALLDMALNLFGFECVNCGERMKTDFAKRGVVVVFPCENCTVTLPDDRWSEPRKRQKQEVQNG